MVGANRPAQGGQNRPAHSGGNRPAQGGQNRPSGGGPRPGGGGRGGRPPARGINQGRRRYRPAPLPKVELPLPEKITFYESLSVAELGKN